ncbi:MAG TPA: pyridoxal phosphate-dependent aminotransferase [Spirochaetota bacterium]|nr:pyridoxal phosphate-dependent aminotransferase [Spirochaetota bacterium]
MAVSKYIQGSIEKSSWIRKMFEEGTLLKAKFGEENVYDFSLGNPDIAPPEKFFDVLKQIINARESGKHGYMPNAGFPDVNTVIADKVSKEHGVSVLPSQIVMTCGAAGGMNVVLKTILDPGDEVIVTKPYFVEYGFYVQNHSGTLVLTDTNEDFSLNIENIKNAITPKTKAVIINSPNNPTGRIYPEKDIQALSVMLNEKSAGSPIYIISDEPYRDIIYDNVTVPSVLAHYDNSFVITSYSKTLSVPGERIGYIAANPKCADLPQIMAGLVLSNRILGFVNAPALMQRAVAHLVDESVDVQAYRRRRDLFVEGLRSAGYEFPVPEGAFYIFCKSPLKDDVAFVQHLLKYNILAVPGVGFGGPGYFRLAYCVSEDVIARSLPKFKEAIESL